MDAWIEEMWCIYTMEFYSVIKKNEIMSFVGKWMGLEVVMLSEIRQSHKDKYFMFSLICRIWREAGKWHCYSLNMKCPSQAHVLKVLTWAGGTILGGFGDFRRWDLPGGSRSLGGMSFGAVTCPGLPSFSLLPVFREWRPSHATHCCCHDALSHQGPRNTELNDCALKPLKLWAKINFSSS
jgi:hypothetical protein